MTIDVEGFKRRAAAVAGVGFLLISGAGCSAEPTPVPTSAAPTAAPVFASDEEALAAATEAYADYLKAYDEYWAGLVPKAEYLELSTGSVHEGEEESMAEWEEKGWKAVGKTTFDSIKLQSVSQAGSGEWRIRAYLCVDATEGDVVNADGVSVAQPDRPLRLPLEIEFLTPPDAPIDLKISESKVWSGTNFC
jgi:hypothetical protein